MKEKNAGRLWLKYKSGQTTTAENHLVERWFHELNEDETVQLSALEIEEAHQQMYVEVHNQIKHKSFKKTLWPRFIGAAAAIIAVVGFCLFLLYPNKSNLTASNHLILPGGNKATLTLANGKVINLNEAVKGELATQAGIVIRKKADGELEYTVQSDRVGSAEMQGLNTVSTPRGGQYRINLPDGSSVWLNAASELKFPPNFNKYAQRKVILNGEAYFEVAKDAKPFIVVTGQQEVKVLGTHFNISGYGEEETTKTTLLEGSVSILNLRSNLSTILKPGEQNLLKGNRMHIYQVDTEEAIAWKNGYFTFNREDLGSIMRKISRWYDVEIDAPANPLLMQKEFSGTVSRFGNVSDVLEMLELTDEVRFKIEGRRIIIMK